MRVEVAKGAAARAVAGEEAVEEVVVAMVVTGTGAVF